MTRPIRSSFLLVFVLALLAVVQSNAFAGDENSAADPEIIQELLDTVGRLTLSSWGRCPYLGVRVRAPYISHTAKSGYVLVVFDVSTAGRAINSEIVDSNLGQDRQLEALELIDLFRFRPVIREEGTLVFENWVERIDFLPEGVGPDPAWPQSQSYLDERCR